MALYLIFVGWILKWNDTTDSWSAKRRLIRPVVMLHSRVNCFLRTVVLTPLLIGIDILNYSQRPFPTDVSKRQLKCLHLFVHPSLDMFTVILLSQRYVKLASRAYLVVLNKMTLWYSYRVVNVTAQSLSSFVDCQFLIFIILVIIFMLKFVSFMFQELLIHSWVNVCAIPRHVPLGYCGSLLSNITLLEQVLLSWLVLSALQTMSIIFLFIWYILRTYRRPIKICGCQQRLENKTILKLTRCSSLSDWRWE